MFDLKSIFSAASTSGTPQSVVGIDIGSSSIKVVELEQREKALALRTYGEVQLAPYAEGSLGDVIPLPVALKAEALVDVIREAGVASKDAVLALPLSSSFVTIMALTAKPDEDISSRVRVEARKYIPIPLSDVTLDWTELDPIGKKAPETVREILIAAVQSEAYANMNTIMQGVNKVSQPSEIELFSTLRSLSYDSDTSIAVIDLGAETSKLYIAHEGMLRKLHRVRSGGVQTTKRIAELLNISFTDAENRKRNYQPNQPGSDDIKKAAISTFERPLQEFRRVLAQYEMKVGTPVHRVVITGGAASFPEMVPFTSYMFDREVELAFPFSKVAYPAFMEDNLRSFGTTFSVAIGAALRPYQ